jgi:hypothetical protein
VISIDWYGSLLRPLPSWSLRSPGLPLAREVLTTSLTILLGPSDAVLDFAGPSLPTLIVVPTQLCDHAPAVQRLPQH